MSKTKPSSDLFSPETSRVFSKSQIVSSKRYYDRRDILNAVLSDNKLYSHSDIERLINQFLKGKVI